ncbi:hypothetical protein [Malonomonas rubra]|uniref:hypothetical protein n=1 Tax=Malonomonas rubra TaxID=57040 RepID=UPI0026EADD27|nr:hypothetical protein [Malonomonas rubra]
MPVKTLKRLALSFWLRVPVAIVSRELRLNPKTVSRHYNLMRQGIAEVEGGGARECEEPVQLSLLVDSEMDRVVVGPAASLQSACCQLFGCDWKYGEIICCQAPLGEIFCRVYLTESVAQQGMPNWLKTIDKLARIARGMCRRTTKCHGQSQQMLLNEIAFRFNHRSNPGASAILYDFFKNS